MLPIYSMVVDILDMNDSTSVEIFREQVSPCLSYLEALSVSVDRKPGSETFYPRPSEPDRFGCVGHSVRFVGTCSVGRERAVGLGYVFHAIVRLIEMELPQFQVRHEMSKMEFS